MFPQYISCEVGGNGTGCSAEPATRWEVDPNGYVTSYSIGRFPTSIVCRSTPAPVPSVSGSVVRVALTSSTSLRASSAKPNPEFFTDVAVTSGAVGLNVMTILTRMDTFAVPNQSSIALQGSFSPQGVVFTGTATATINGNEYPLQSPQFAIPDTVPLDRTIHELRVPGTTETLRLFVGSVPGHDDLMRVCWRIEIGPALGVTCTRNRKRDGRPVGAEALHDLGSGRTLEHVANDYDPDPRSVLRCTELIIEGGRGPDDPVRTRNETYAAVFRWDGDRVHFNGAPVTPSLQASSPDNAGCTTTSVGQSCWASPAQSWTLSPGTRVTEYGAVRAISCRS